MDLAAMVDEKLVSFQMDGMTKDDVMQNIAQLMYDAGVVDDYSSYLTGLFEREQEMVTGIGNGIAIPHCRCSSVKRAAFTFVKLDNPIDWGSLDDEPVKYVIMLAAPDNGDNEHLKMLSLLARYLMDDDFKADLFQAKNLGEIQKAFRKKAAKKED